MSQIEIIPLRTNSVRKASSLLSKSFLDNPSSTCILDNMPVKKRRKKLYFLHLGLTDACIAYPKFDKICLKIGKFEKVFIITIWKYYMRHDRELM